MNTLPDQKNDQHIQRKINGDFCLVLTSFVLNPIPYGGGLCFSPPQTDIANYGVFCIENMLFYYLTFHITGIPNFWWKQNLKFFGGSHPSGPLKIKEISDFFTFCCIATYHSGNGYIKSNYC